MRGLHTEMAVFAKRRVLAYVRVFGPVSSADVMGGLDYETQAGAAATLLRLHRHGHLRRERFGLAYLYTISEKGTSWLSLFAESDEGTATR